MNRSAYWNDEFRVARANRSRQSWWCTLGLVLLSSACDGPSATTSSNGAGETNVVDAGSGASADTARGASDTPARSETSAAVSGVSPIPSTNASAGDVSSVGVETGDEPSSTSPAVASNGTEPNPNGTTPNDASSHPTLTADTAPSGAVPTDDVDDSTSDELGSVSDIETTGPVASDTTGDRGDTSNPVDATSDTSFSSDEQPDCVQGHTRCSNDAPDVREQCDADGRWVAIGECPSACQGGLCVDCASGARACNGKVPLSCVAGYWQEATACANTCSQGECLECLSGGVRCHEGSRETCSEGGTWQVDEVCSGNCINGTCVACEAGQAACNGQVPTTCVAGQWSEGEPCADTCWQGQCVECTPGSERCADGQREECTTTGTWRAFEICAHGCGDAVNCACEATDPAICSENTPMTCVDGRWEAAQSCDACDNGHCCNEYCTVRTCDAFGQCYCEETVWICSEPLPKCEPGTRLCDGTDVFECVDPDTWQFVRTCAYACLDGGICGGTCVPGESERCKPGSVDILQSCNGQGQYEDDFQCTNACSGGECTGYCKPGSTECWSSTELVTCNGAGEWGEPTTCELGCSGTACVTERPVSCDSPSAPDIVFTDDFETYSTGTLRAVSDDLWMPTSGTRDAVFETSSFYIGDGTRTAQLDPVPFTGGVSYRLLNRTSDATPSRVSLRISAAVSSFPESEYGVLFGLGKVLSQFEIDRVLTVNIRNRSASVTASSETLELSSTLDYEMEDLTAYRAEVDFCARSFTLYSQRPNESELLVGQTTIPAQMVFDAFFMGSNVSFRTLADNVSVAIADDCDPGGMRCSGTSIQECNGLRSWVTVEECEFVCSNSTCGGECTPGVKQCKEMTTNVAQSCGEDGTWTEQVCPTACVDGRCPPLFEEGFEVCPPPGWTLLNDWECGSPSVVGPTAAYAGSNVLATRIAANHSSNQSFATTIAQTPIIDLSNATHPVLTFRAYVHTEGVTYDGFNLKVSTDGGSTYQALTGVTPAYNLTVAGEPAWGGFLQDLGYQPFQVDLAAYVGQQVRLRFGFRSDSVVNYSGVYIDEFSVVEAP